MLPCNYSAATSSLMFRLRLRPRRHANQCRCSAESQRQPARRSQKPVRSKGLSPQSLDPEAVLQPPDADWRGEPVTRQRMTDPGSLPAAYQQLDLEPSQAGTSPSGFFYRDRADLVSQVRRHKKQAMRTDAPMKQPAGLSLNYRYSVGEDGHIVDMIKAKKAVPATFQHAFLQDSTVDGDQDGPPLPSMGSGSSAGRYLPLDEADTSALQGSLVQGEVAGRRPQLKAFVYCVGQNELFTPLWEMDMVDQIEWVSSLAEANIVIHRRPQPGEKQFHYDQFRSEAQQQGIPFVSINAPTARELQKSLLPAMDLYYGKPAAAGKGPKPKQQQRKRFIKTRSRGGGNGS